MTVLARALPELGGTYAHDLPELVVPWTAAAAPAPSLLTLNEGLAVELGLDPAALRTPEGVAQLVGATPPPGAEPVAMAYAGHQFGGWSPRLGDGRALLLGELVDPDGRRHDLHLKGSGRTPFARGGDGKAAVGPMLREHLVSEALHALGIPTTRALAVVATGETVARETPLPGAVLVRVAASHLRVGTFEYALRTGGAELVARLAAHAIRRHHPGAAAAGNPPLALLEAVAEAQAALIARWMLVGFVHGVMNTDNMAISGETIDYGPCAFLDAYDPATVFSSIDHGGRYAYANQPAAAQWNLARLAEALLPLVDPDPDRAIALAMPVLEAFPDRYGHHWRAGARAKLGLAGAEAGDQELAEGFLELLRAGGVDLTQGFRTLADHVRGDAAPARALRPDPVAFDGWAGRWRERLGLHGRDARAVADAMDRVNPHHIPRNHLVEEALAAATAGDTGPVERALELLAHPFEERPGAEPWAAPAPAGVGPHRTFCGT